MTRNPILPFVALAICLATGCAPVKPLESTSAGTTKGQPVQPSEQNNMVRPPTPTPSIGNTESSQNEPQANIELVRYIGVDYSRWNINRIPGNFSDLYSRIEVQPGRREGFANSSAEGVGQSDVFLRSYANEEDGMLHRLFYSDSANTVATLLNIQIHDPDLKVAVPLFSVTHASGSNYSKNGNTWETNFTTSYVDSPLFRIGPNTTITIHLNAKVSSDVKSQGASLAIGAITQAVHIAAPTSTLFTSLSKTDVTNTANAIDTALSGLLTQEISEDIQLGKLADSWGTQDRLQIYGCAPFVRIEGKSGNKSPSNDYPCGKEKDFDGNVNIPVGVWDVRLACPRISVFDARDICSAELGNIFTEKADTPPVSSGQLPRVRVRVADPVALLAAQHTIARTIKDAEVLQFKLSSQITIQSFVQSQSWYTNFISKKREDPDYTYFCTNAIMDLEGNGLSKFDSVVVLRSLIRQMPQLVALKKDFLKDQEGCMSFIAEATGDSNL